MVMLIMPIMSRMSIVAVVSAGITSKAARMMIIAVIVLWMDGIIVYE